MNDDDRQLIVGSLLGDVTDEEVSQLSRKLEESAEFREGFLDQLDIEAFLSAEANAGAFAEDKAAFFSELETAGEAKIVPFTRRLWFRALAATTAAAACLMLFFGVLAPRPLSAASALEKMIDAAREAGDRTY